MPWNLLILPLAAGYYLRSRSNWFYFFQQRLDTQRLIFDSTVAGIFILLFSFVIKELVELVIPDGILFLYQGIREVFSLNIPYFGTTVCSFLIAVVFTEICNLLFCSDRQKQIERAINKVGNDLEMMLRFSIKDSIALNFTLNTNKVYIGLVRELPEPTSEYVTIIPILSGYRDKNKNLILDTHYLSVYSEYVKEGKILDISELHVDYIITIKNLVTISYFDIDMYDRFSHPQNTTTQT